jgi:4-amino-4-deoxy-L-arabinose transferase-like glycosyltransferase
MTSNRPRPDSARSREILIVLALTFLGGVIRLWSPGRLGLVHFDEGIYAIAGHWVLSPRGFQELDGITAYAPPAFPVLVGMFYLGLGVGDFSAILVSIVAGTLTIPAAAWLAARTFGKGAGGAAAAFTALSGPHIVFSRMALVDASFLLAWLLAIGQGERFLERPTPSRAVLFGLTVGVAQLFKYSGWISGVIVGLTAAAWLFVHSSQWRSRHSFATWVWGSAAALVAAAVYSPWYQFVESHGGYRALLKHQQGYLGGVSSWPGHLYLQLTQATALSGGPAWLAAGGLAATLAIYASTGDFATERQVLPRMLIATAGLTALCVIPSFGWWVVAGWILFGLISNVRIATRSACVLAVGWMVLTIMTPFYHPYARLWLPVHAFGWLVSSGVFVWVRSRIEVWGRGRPLGWNPGRSDALPWLATLCVMIAALGTFTGVGWPWHDQSAAVLAPTDSLRAACRSTLTELPNDVTNLRVFARPPVSFYLSSTGRLGVFPQPDIDRALVASDPATWSVIDLAMVRQNGVAPQLLEQLQRPWDRVRDYHTTLSTPALLDIDPSAGCRDAIASESDALLRLLRPKRGGNP